MNTLLGLAGLGIICTASLVYGQSIPPQHVGDWLLVNGNMVLQLEADGTMIARNSGEKGKLTMSDGGTFSWDLPKKQMTGKITADRLFLDNAQPDMPQWLRQLEFRRAEPKVAQEMIEFALRQQNQVLNAFANVRTKSVEAAVRNNLRQLSAAADQYYLEHGKTTVALSELVGPGKYVKELKPVDGENYSNLEFRLGGDALRVTTASGVAVTFDPYPHKPKP